MLKKMSSLVWIAGVPAGVLLAQSFAASSQESTHSPSPQWIAPNRVDGTATNSDEDDLRQGYQRLLEAENYALKVEYSLKRNSTGNGNTQEHERVEGKHGKTHGTCLKNGGIEVYRRGGKAVFRESVSDAWEVFADKGGDESTPGSPSITKDHGVDFQRVQALVKLPLPHEILSSAGLKITDFVLQQTDEPDSNSTMNGKRVFAGNLTEMTARMLTPKHLWKRGELDTDPKEEKQRIMLAAPLAVSGHLEVVVSGDGVIESLIVSTVVTRPPSPETETQPGEKVCDYELKIALTDFNKVNIAVPSEVEALLNRS